MTRETQENEIIEEAQSNDDFVKNMKALFANMTADQIDNLHRAAVQAKRKVTVQLTLSEMETVITGLGWIIDQAGRGDDVASVQALENRLKVQLGANQD